MAAATSVVVLDRGIPDNPKKCYISSILLQIEFLIN